MVRSRSHANEKQTRSPTRARSKRLSHEQVQDSQTVAQNISNFRSDERSIDPGELTEARCRKRKRSGKLHNAHIDRSDCILQRLEHHTEQKIARRPSVHPGKRQKLGKKYNKFRSMKINDPDYSVDNELDSCRPENITPVIKKKPGRKRKNIAHTEDDIDVPPLDGKEEAFLESADFVSESFLKSSDNTKQSISGIRRRVDKFSKVISVEKQKLNSDFHSNGEKSVFILDDSDSEDGIEDGRCQERVPTVFGEMKFSRKEVIVDATKVIDDIDFPGVGKHQRFAKLIDNNPVPLRLSNGKRVSAGLRKSEGDKRQSNNSIIEKHSKEPYSYKNSMDSHHTLSSLSPRLQLPPKKKYKKVQKLATENLTSPFSIRGSYGSLSDLETLSGKKSVKKKGLKKAKNKQQSNVDTISIQDSIMVNGQSNGLLSEHKAMRKMVCNPNSPLKQFHFSKAQSKDKAVSQRANNVRIKIGKRSRRDFEPDLGRDTSDLQVSGYDSSMDGIDSEDDWTDEDDGFLRKLAKSKKEPRFGNEYSKPVFGVETGNSISSRFDESESPVKEREYFPREMESCYLDEVSEMVHRLSMAKLEQVSTKAAILFLESCIIEWYSKAEKLRRSIIAQKNNNSMATNSLLSARKSIAGIWCVFTRLLLLLAHAISNKGSVTSRWIPRDFDHIEEQQCEELSKSLIDFTFMVLDQVACCPLVGNHAWIALTYSKIAQVAHGCSIFHEGEDPIEGSHRSLKAARNVCRQATGNGRDSKPYFNEQILIQLEKLDIFEAKSTVSLWHCMGNVFAGDEYNIEDHASKLLIIQEIGMLEFRQRLMDHLSGCAPDWLSLSQELSRLTIPADVSCIFVNDLSNSNDSLTSSESAKTKFAVKKFDATPGINGVTMRHTLKIKQGPIDKEFKYFDVDWIDTTKSQSFIEEISFESIHISKAISLIFQNPVEDRPVKYTIRCDCQTCNSNFTSSSQMQSKLPHLKCAFTSGSISNPESSVSFGKSAFLGDWSRHSLDPENGPHLSQDELSDVLAYSVEWFEADCIDFVTSTNTFGEYSLQSPFFLGQVGLRCQYCRNANDGCFDIPGSFVFPESVEEFPVAMWYLCMTHLDNCVNLPRSVRNWHHEYRKHVNMSSFLPSDYWSNVAYECDLFSAKLGGIVRRPRSIKKKLSCLAQASEVENCLR